MATGSYRGSTSTAVPSGQTGTFVLDDAVNNAASNVLAVVHTTSGTPTNGIAAGLPFQIEDSANNRQTIVTLRARASDVTQGSEDGALRVALTVAGAVQSAGAEALDVAYALTIVRAGTASRLEIADFGTTFYDTAGTGSPFYDFCVGGTFLGGLYSWGPTFASPADGIQVAGLSLSAIAAGGLSVAATDGTGGAIRFYAGGATDASHLRFKLFAAGGARFYTGVIQKYRTVTGDATYVVGDHTIFANTASGAINLTTMAPADCAGQTFEAAKTSTSNTMTITPVSGLIHNAASYQVAAASLGSVTYRSDGTNFWVI